MHHDAADPMNRPPIKIEERHYARLSALASKADSPMDACEYLREELERACIASSTDWNPEVVSLESKVEFRDGHTGKIQEITLVYPSEADNESRRVSVLTRIGAALIGLSANQTISFRNRFGDLRELTVINVTRPK
jgi:regulator of nucleoside diphosphate kinase